MFFLFDIKTREKLIKALNSKVIINDKKFYLNNAIDQCIDSVIKEEGWKMSRYMRIILFYDLAMKEVNDLKSYTKFRKWLIKRGYIMLQYSIYVKVVNASTKLKYEITAIKKVLPKHGHVRVLSVSDAQYGNMQVLSGQKTLNEIVNSNERYLRIDKNEDI